MANDEDHFRVRPGRVRDRAGGRATRAVRPRPKTFLAEVHQAIRRAGGDPNRLGSAGKGSGRFNARGRGATAAAGLKDRSAWSRDASGGRTRARCVTAKAHKRAAFTCGNDRIDSYFHETVSQNVKRNDATCFVAREVATDRVAGFSTPSSSNVPLTEVRFRPAGRGRSAWSAKRSQMFVGLRSSEPR